MAPNTNPQCQRPRTNNSHEPVTVWQWNCRSYRNKQHSLHHYVQPNPPTIIALQETDVDAPHLQGYVTFVTGTGTRTAIMVKSHQPAQAHTLPTDIDYVFVELLPASRQQTSTFVLNIYSPPLQSLPNITTLLRIVRQRTKGQELIIAADFNAHHTSWGYIRDSKKGQQVYEAIRQNNLHLCNAPGICTRIGNSVNRELNAGSYINTQRKPPRNSRE